MIPYRDIVATFRCIWEKSFKNYSMFCLVPCTHTTYFKDGWLRSSTLSVFTSSHSTNQKTFRSAGHFHFVQSYPRDSNSLNYLCSYIHSGPNTSTQNVLRKRKLYHYNINITQCQCYQRHPMLVVEGVELNLNKK